LQVVQSVHKGRSVVATKEFRDGEFVVGYEGELIDLPTAKLREKEYSHSGVGCYMFYFQFHDKTYW